MFARDAVRVGGMQARILGASTRLCLNVLTGALSVFGAWGWMSQVNLDHFAPADLGNAILAVITLVLQQLANGLGAHAARLWSSGRHVVALLGLALTGIFASVPAVGAEHAWTAIVSAQRAAANAPIIAEIAALERELGGDRAALRAIPANVPGSRITLLQAPLREAIAQSEERLTRVRAERASIDRAGGDGIAANIFKVLGFAEPCAYWFLAASAAVPHDAPQDNVPTPTRVPLAGRAASRRKRRFVPLLTGAQQLLAALAMFAPGAVKPPAAAPQPSVTINRDPDPTARLGGDAPNQASQSKKSQQRNARGTPRWLGQAIALRQAGLSFRAIDRRLSVPKSSAARWLKKLGIERGAAPQ